MARRLLSLAHVAKRLDLSVKSVRKLWLMGLLPEPRQQLGMNFWFEDDVDEYLRRLDRGTLPEPKPLPQKRARKSPD